MAKRGIRDLKKDLDDSLKSLAEVKATAIRTKREATNLKEQSEDYKKKLELLYKWVLMDAKMRQKQLV